MTMGNSSSLSMVIGDTAPARDLRSLRILNDTRPKKLLLRATDGLDLDHRISICPKVVP